MAPHFKTARQDVMLTPYPGSDKLWIVRTPILYYSEVLQAEIGSDIVGLITDLLSIPEIFNNIALPYGKYTIAGILHDLEYRLQRFPKDLIDKMFLEVLRILNYEGLENLEDDAFYEAVHLGGQGAWDKDKQEGVAAGFVQISTTDFIQVPKIIPSSIMSRS
jgi:Protein of unknown function (DUF1353)